MTVAAKLQDVKRDSRKQNCRKYPQKRGRAAKEKRNETYSTKVFRPKRIHKGSTKAKAKISGGGGKPQNPGTKFTRPWP